MDYELEHKQQTKFVRKIKFEKIFFFQKGVTK